MVDDHLMAAFLCLKCSGVVSLYLSLLGEASLSRSLSLSVSLFLSLSFFLSLSVAAGSFSLSVCLSLSISLSPAVSFSLLSTAFVCVVIIARERETGEIKR